MSRDENEEGGDGLKYVLAPLYSILAAWGVYTTFIVCGALLVTVVDGKIRLAVAVLLAFVFPALTAMGFNNVRKEGATGIEIVSRIALGTTILSFGTAFIIGLTMTEKVVGNMYNDPNWFVDEPYRQDGFPALNRKYHRIVAEGFCKLAHSAGTYYCPEH